MSVSWSRVLCGPDNLTSPVGRALERCKDVAGSPRDRYRHLPSLRFLVLPRLECVDHALDVAGQRLEVDGKPHPGLPSHAQASQPMGALQLGVRSLDPGPHSVPLAPLLGGLHPPAPFNVDLQC